MLYIVSKGPDEIGQSRHATFARDEGAYSGIAAMADAMKQLSDLQLILYNYSSPDTTGRIDEVLSTSQKLIDIINGPLLQYPTSVVSTTIDTSLDKLPDSATILLVLSCYTRLLHLYDLLITSGQAGPSEQISIGSFLLAPSSGVQMAIISKLVLHLFDGIDRAIGVNLSSSYRNYTSGDERGLTWRPNSHDTEERVQWGGAGIAALEVVTTEVRILEHKLSKKLQGWGQEV
jgi:hypothetical protein